MITMNDSFDKAWSVVKDDGMQEAVKIFNEHRWENFHPDTDTCDGCGGQKTPWWPGYGPEGPDNGNCASELDECDNSQYQENLSWRTPLEADALYGGTAHRFEHWDADQVGSEEQEADAFALDRAFRAIHGDPNNHESGDLRTWAKAVMELHDRQIQGEYNG